MCIKPSTFDGLLFPHGPEDRLESADSRTIKQQTRVPVYKGNGEGSTRIHKNTLYIEKIEYGRILTELPFSHPRQLVEMIPALRQYAFLSTLLAKSFGSKPEKVVETQQQKPEKSKRDEFAEFMAQASPRDDDPLSRGRVSDYAIRSTSTSSFSLQGSQLRIL